MIDHVLDKFSACAEIDAIYVVTNRRYAPNFRAWSDAHGGQFAGKTIHIVDDGTTSNEDRLGAIGDIGYVLRTHNIDDDLIVVAGDNLFSGTLEGFVATAKQRGVLVGVYDVGDLEQIRKYNNLGLDSEGRITGNYTSQEASDLALTLRSGALPASLTYLEERTVGPSLGADSVRAGVYASAGGLLFVLLFMLVYYKLAGFNAFVSISINLILLLGMMAYAGAVMTLPGIAGFILTIGMGVDSNVLIFERIKEELATGKTPKAAISAGFDRVFWTIVDTHVASLISAAFLFQFGTGPIRGFATTLTIGLLSNVFTAVFVSRAMF